jgi:hypothetical protein
MDYISTPLLWNVLKHTNPLKKDENQDAFEEIFFKLVERGANMNATLQSSSQQSWYHKSYKGANALSLLLNPSASTADILLMRKIIRMGARLPPIENITAASMLLPIIWNDLELFCTEFFFCIFLFASDSDLLYRVALVASEAGGYAFYHNNISALTTAIEHRATKIAAVLVTDAANVVQKEQARSIISCCIKKLSSKLLGRFLELLFEKQPNMAENRGELLDLKCMDNWLAAPARNLNNKTQFDVLETLIRYALPKISPRVPDGVSLTNLYLPWSQIWCCLH